nr:MAG TPA: hypothetical protein [Caudoviricetes sp.]
MNQILSFSRQGCQMLFVHFIAIIPHNTTIVQARLISERKRKRRLEHIGKCSENDLSGTQPRPHP